MLNNYAFGSFWISSPPGFGLYGALLITLFFNNVHAATNGPTALQIKGFITRSRTPGAYGLVSWTNSFSVVFGPQVTIATIGDPASPRIESVEAGSLDNDSYLLIRFATNLLVSEATIVRDGVFTKVPLKHPLKPINDAMLFLDQGHVPDGHYGLLAPVWLAYGISHYLPAKETAIAKFAPVFPLQDDFDEHGGTGLVEYHRHKAMPFLAQSIVQCVKKESFTKVGSVPFFSGIFTNATYSVSEWTNVLGNSRPAKFTATNYLPKGEHFAFFGLVTQIVVAAEQARGLQIPNVTHVVERRAVLTKENVAYAYTTRDGSLWPASRLAKEAAPDLAAKHTRRVLWPLHLMLVLSAIPLCYLWRGAPRRKLN